MQRVGTGKISRRVAKTQRKSASIRQIRVLRVICVPFPSVQILPSVSIRVLIFSQEALCVALSF